MTHESFDKIKSELSKFSYQSLNYYGYEEVKHFEVIIETDTVILLYGKQEMTQCGEFHWAANEIEELVDAINQSKCDGLIGFVPEAWVDALYQIGFKDFARWHDYWYNNMEVYHKSRQEIVYATETMLQEVSDVTFSCKGQSNGFNGLTIEWLTKWLHNDGLGAQNGNIIVYKEYSKVVGVAVVGTYSNRNNDQNTLWIHAVAVAPSKQGKGIGYTLMQQALEYGKMHDADRAFLAADACNHQAIKLYKKIGFVPDEEGCEINLIRQ